MGLLKKENNNCVGCEHCEKKDVDLTFFKTNTGMPHFYCRECVIQQFNMFPVEFDKKTIIQLIDNKFKDINKHEILFTEFYNFIEFVKPFLERKIMEKCEWCGRGEILCNMSMMNQKNIYCKSCIIKALLFVMPINFDEKLVLSTLRFGEAYCNIKENEERDKFINWIKTFLESK